MVPRSSSARMSWVASDFFMNSRRALESAGVSPAGGGAGREAQRSRARARDNAWWSFLRLTPGQRAGTDPFDGEQRDQERQQRPHAPRRCLLDLGRPASAAGDASIMADRSFEPFKTVPPDLFGDPAQQVVVG